MEINIEEKSVKNIDINKLQEYLQKQPTLIDIRKNSEFSHCHIKGSINLTYNSTFGKWV